MPLKRQKKNRVARQARMGEGKSAADKTSRGASARSGTGRGSKSASAAGKGRKPPTSRSAKPARIRPKTPVPAVENSQMRLQKFLAAAGIGSRRDCEVLIVEGRIEVDDQVVTELGTRIDPEKNDVRFDGQRVRLQRLQYFMLNKPPGVLSTAQDPAGRTRVVDLISSQQRVYNVGRLDKSSEGLILVTNDGPLAQYLTHPSFGVEKVYHVWVRGTPRHEELSVLKHGVHLMEGIAKVKDVQIRKRNKGATELSMILDEGKNREIRRMLAKLGHKVVRLVRVAIGPLKLGDLPAGAHRRLTVQEVAELKNWAERTARGLPPKTVIKQKKRPSAGDKPTQGRSTDDPVRRKLAAGRPIHLEDLQKARHLETPPGRTPSSTGKPTGKPAGKSAGKLGGKSVGQRTGKTSGIKAQKSAGGTFRSSGSRPTKGVGRKTAGKGGSPSRGKSKPTQRPPGRAPKKGGRSSK